MYAVLCLAAQSCLTFCDPMGCSLPEHLCPWRFSRQGYWSGLPCPPPLSQPGIGLVPPAVNVWSANRWTAREFPELISLRFVKLVHLTYSCLGFSRGSSKDEMNFPNFLKKYLSVIY